MVSVQEAARETGVAASSTRDSAASLVDEVGSISVQVDQFLTEVKKL